jgi:hypothetical protein
MLALVPSGMHNLGPKRADGVHIVIGGPEKESLTVIATLRANGQTE